MKKNTWLKNMLKVLSLLLLTSAVYGAGTKSEGKAPEFSVKSGDNKALSLADLKGKIAVLFYEDKDAIEKNREIKTELKKYLDKQPTKVKDLYLRVSVIDCSQAKANQKNIYEKKLIENSKKEDLTIYGDWDGKMAGTYKMKKKDSNFLIIDNKGVIKYFETGKVNPNKLPEIKKLLKNLYPEE